MPSPNKLRIIYQNEIDLATTTITASSTSSGVDADFQRESIHQIWGKMTQVPGVTYTNYEIYTTKLELEEV